MGLVKVMETAYGLRQLSLALENTERHVLCNGEKHHVAFEWLEQPELAGQPRVRQRAWFTLRME